MSRGLNDRTVAIRAALVAAKGKLTYSEAVEQNLFDDSLGVTQRNFDAAKFQWLKAVREKRAARQARKAASTEVVFTAVDFADAINAVKTAGSRDALEAEIKEKTRLLAAYDSFSALTQSVAG